MGNVWTTMPKKQDILFGINHDNIVGEIKLDNPVDTYMYLIEELNKLDFSYVELMRQSPNSASSENYGAVDEIDLFGRKIRHTVIANSEYDKVSAEAELERGIAKLISFGKLYIANPDLPERYKKNAKLTEPDWSTIYGGGAHGYIDYPFCSE